MNEDERLEEALEESFPASDPIAIDPDPKPWDNAELHRFELDIDGQVAILKYMRKPGVLSLIHTEVPPSLSGRGIAATLAKFALDLARKEGLKVKAVCPFVQVYLRRHPEEADIVG